MWHFRPGCGEKYCSIHVRKMILNSCDCHPRFAQVTNLPLVLESTLSHLYRKLPTVTWSWNLSYTYKDLEKNHLYTFVQNLKEQFLIIANVQETGWHLLEFTIKKERRKLIRCRWVSEFWHERVIIYIKLF